MRKYSNGGVLISSVDELPSLPDEIELLGLDLETTSGKPDTASTNPHRDCELLGAAFSFGKEAYYAPVRHHNPTMLEPNLPVEAVCSYLRNMIGRSVLWVNHNLKYDAHVLSNSCGINVLEHPVQLVDTLTLAKLYDSDAFDNSLSALAQRILGKNIYIYEEAFKEYLKTPAGKWKNKDYGAIPINLMGPYATEDVFTVLSLYRFFKERIACQ